MSGLDRLLAPLVGRVRLMVGRGVITAVDDAPMAQELQIDLLHEESHDGVERFGDYGFTSRPLPGAEVVTVAVGGTRSHQIAVGVVDRRHRPTGLQPGEAMLHDDQGQQVKLKRDGIDVRTSKSATIAAEGDVAIGGDNVALTSEGELNIQSAEPAVIQAPEIALNGPTTITPPLAPPSGGTGVGSIAALRALLAGEDEGGGGGGGDPGDVLTSGVADARYARDFLVISAGEALGGHRAVYIASDDEAYHGNPDATARLVIGITTGAAIMGADATIQIGGEIEEPSWAWNDDGPIWLAANGQLTQALPVAGYLFQVGVPMGPTKMRIEPQLVAQLT